MTAKKELNNWLSDLEKKRTKSETDLYKKKIEESILSQNAEEQLEGLIALKESLKAFNKEVDQKMNTSKIQVYPSSVEEIELLKSLFLKMNIRFDLK